ncbi:hypothetical protein B0H13DRAFT_2341045 [Mycena leptocephala]|nr:hypothetical protein B0H13DRAFT_2341045 [Mycena leptocephala]
MAAPFVYVPEADTSTPYTAPYHNPYYPTPQPGPSPFLPPSPSCTYPSSPYLRASDLPGSPNAFNVNSILWPEDAPQYESQYAASWIPLEPRQRTNSWHGPALPPSSPFLAPTVPAFLRAQQPSFRPGHKKAKSWGTAPSWVTNANPYLNGGAAQPSVLIHPWLNGDTPSLHFDCPLRRVATAPPTSALVNDAELREPAAAPITLADVLVALHHALHTRITHADWATLGAEHEARVTQAFAARCRAFAARSGAGPVQLRDREVTVRNQGVKRIDFLLGKTVFKGLVHDPGDLEGCVRMATA